MPTPASQSLHYGSSHAPLARVVPDDTWPSMWRIVWPDGERSDMVNLARAKHAAVVLAMRRHKIHDARKLRWMQDCGESPPERPPVAQNVAEDA